MFEVNGYFQGRQFCHFKLAFFLGRGSVLEGKYFLPEEQILSFLNWAPFGRFFISRRSKQEVAKCVPSVKMAEKNVCFMYMTD